MSRCKKCNIEILDQTEKCPLCNFVLEKNDIPVHAMYPNVRTTTRRLWTVANCFLFGSILIESILVYVDYLTSEHMWWSMIAALVLIYANVVMRLAILGRSGYTFKILSLTFMAIVFLVGVDFLTGYRGWSVNVILPLGIIIIDIFVILLMIVNRRNWQSYMMLQIFMILLSIIPLVFVATNIIVYPYYAIVAMGLSVFIFLGTLIIGDQRARTELKRRFHV